MTRCGKEFNTPSCWSNLDQEACNNFTADNNTTVENNDDTSDNIVTSNFDNLSEPLVYYNSSCWYPNHLPKMMILMTTLFNCKVCQQSLPTPGNWILAT